MLAVSRVNIEECFIYHRAYEVPSIRVNGRYLGCPLPHGS